MNTATASFAAHSQVVSLRDIVPPQRVVTVPVRVETDRQAIDATADYWLAVERKREADAAAELVTEAQRFPSNPNPHCD